MFDFIFAKEKCTICGEKNIAHYGFCGSCYENLEKLTGDIPIATEYVDRLVAVYSYKGVIKKALWDYKFNDKIDLVYGFSEMLIHKVLEEKLQNFDYVTFVPMTKKSMRKRGYNQSALLAKEISEKVGIKYLDKIQKIKDTKPQIDLDLPKRKSNLVDSFILENGYIRGKSIIIIDDIITTGSTINEVAKVLKIAGAKKIVGMALATPQK